MTWKPHVTVAAIIERNNRFLLVEEHTEYGIAYNQPAGHLEKGESLIDAVKREVNEETAWQFIPEAVTSIQLWRKNPDFPSFLRICFIGKCINHQPNQTLDEGIIATHWLEYDEIVSKKEQLRSPLVLTTIDQYLKGESYPLTLLKTFLDLES